MNNITNLEYDKQIILLYERLQSLIEQHKHFCLLSEMTVDRIVETNEKIDELISVLKEVKKGVKSINFVKNKYNSKNFVLDCSKEVKENFYSIENKIKLLEKEIKGIIKKIQEILENNIVIPYYNSSNDLERTYHKLYSKYVYYCISKFKDLVSLYNHHQELEVDKVPSLFKKIIFKEHITKEKQHEYELILLLNIYSKILSENYDTDDYDLVSDIGYMYEKDNYKIVESTLLSDLSSSLRHYLKPSDALEKNNRVRNRK